MKSAWDDAEAARHLTDLDLRAYTSRLIGGEPALALHGGGNTSVKTLETSVVGEQEEILWIKGSGRDLATIDAQGFAPVRLERLRSLALLEQLTDLQMANELRTSTIDASAPDPSVEAILHGILPAKFVDHTHAEAIISITNTPGGERRVRELFGDLAVVVPYAMPGFELAKLCAELVPAGATEATIGIVLLRHGLFSFGDNARASYERMLDLVTRAEEYLAEHHAWSIALPAGAADTSLDLRSELAQLRAETSAAAGGPLIVSRRDSPAAAAFCRRADVRTLSQQGPATPDHVIRTKRTPLVGRDVQGFVEEYERYFAAHGGTALTMLDPAPRIVLDPVLGLCALGETAARADVAGEIYERTIDVILRSTALDRYEALSPAEVFAVEYWDLEQAKLRRHGAPPPLAGEIALVTGAASGIGRACVDSFLERGAAVIGLDIDPAIEDLIVQPSFLGLRCDVTSSDEVRAALERGVRRFGGIDVLVLNAGVFPPTRPIAELDPDDWRRTMAVNLDAAALLLRETHQLLALAPRGGRVAVVASKNVLAPGAGAAAYSASKAGLTQLARVAALEWASDGIRVNVVHPNAVFDTALWSAELVEQRAASYRMTADDYRKNTLLGVEVRSRDVAEVVAELCGAAFSRTTGAQVTVDGGNERTI